MDPISYSKASQQEQRIKKFVAQPDSIAGLVTVPNLVPTGETVSIPTGRTLVHPNLQVEGTLDLQGTLFIPSGGSVSTTEVDATVVKQNGNVVANDSAVVHKTGNETIAGIKTFSSAINGLSDITGKAIKMVDIVNSRMLYLRYLLGFNRIDSYNSPITNATPLIINSSELQLQINDSTKLKIDTSGNVLVTGSGGLGYGTGSGGTVTQLTNKGTDVTLNKPSGQITMHNASLAAGDSAVFIINCSAFGLSDSVKLTIRGGVSGFTNYSIDGFAQNNGQIVCVLKNITASALAESVIFNFTIIKGSIN